MNTPTRSTGHRRFAAWAAGLLAVLTGCHAIDFYTPSLQAPVPAELQPPRELSKVSLPTYRIEAPDIVRLDVMRLIPRPSYRIDAYDVLQIRGYGVLLQQPIDDYFLVEAGGIVTLGPAYGVVRVEGMTTEEASAAITQMLRTFLPYAQATVRLARSANAQDISREYIVGPDGVINISRFGAVRLIGLTVTEARLAIQERLAPYFDRPVVGVEVVGFNSKFYYVITAEAALLGESVLRFPVTGNETVLDAIGQLSQTPGMHKVSSKTMWVARPVPDSCNEEQILPIHWDAIVRGGETTTNYQLLPRDRLYIVDDNLVAMNNYVNIVTSPIAKLLGVTSLGANTIRNSQTLGRNYNLYRRI